MNFLLPQRYSVAFITGGTSGLGLAAARHYLANNFKVAILDINLTPKASILSELPSNQKRNVLFIQADVSKEDQVKSAVERTIQEFGHIHVVINSAGYGYGERIYSRKRGVAKTQRLTKLLQVNVIGLFNVCKHTASQMAHQDIVEETQDRGIIINISSVASYDGMTGFVSYSASKAALNGMTLPMARDLGKYKIRVLSVAPGYIRTPLNEKMPREFLDRAGFDTPFDRLATPEEFAGFVFNLGNSPFVNGENVRFDGGYRLPKI